MWLPQTQENYVTLKIYQVFCHSIWVVHMSNYNYNGINSYAYMVGLSRSGYIYVIMYINTHTAPFLLIVQGHSPQKLWIFPV